MSGPERPDERSWGAPQDAPADDAEAWDDLRGDQEHRGTAVDGELDPQESVSPADPEWAFAPTVDGGEQAAESAQGSEMLDRICPYLLSEDGISRYSEPDERHRCMAQDPPATLPLAFQERFCLTDRHVRCEMYKVAEEARTQSLAQDDIATEQVRSSRFRPTVRSRPVALEPTTTVVAAVPDGPKPDRQVLIALGAAGAFALVLLVVAVLLGRGGGSPGADGLTTPAPDVVAATNAPGQTLTPLASPDGGLVVATPSPDVRPPILIRYEVQPGERLLAIAERFGTSRPAIVRANTELGSEGNPRDARAGDVLIVPVSPDLTEAEIMATPGFVEFVEP